MVSTNEVTTNDKSPHRKKRILFATTVLVSVVVALTIEPVARKHLSGANEMDLGVVSLRLAYNSGVAFSLGNQLPSAVIIAFTGLATMGIAVYAWRSVPQSRGVAVIGFALIVAGAASNVVDRARREGHRLLPHRLVAHLQSCRYLPHLWIHPGRRVAAVRIRARVRT